VTTGSTATCTALNKVVAAQTVPTVPPLGPRSFDHGSHGTDLQIKPDQQPVVLERQRDSHVADDRGSARRRLGTGATSVASPEPYQRPTRHLADRGTPASTEAGDARQTTTGASASPEVSAPVRPSPSLVLWRGVPAIGQVTGGRWYGRDSRRSCARSSPPLAEPRSSATWESRCVQERQAVGQVDLKVLSRGNRDHDRGQVGGTVGTVWAATTLLTRAGRVEPVVTAAPQRSPTLARGCRRAGWSWRIPLSG